MKRLSKLFFIILMIGFLSLFVKGYFYKKEIESNKEETVCKFVYCKRFPKTTESFFTYTVNDRRYRNSYGICPENYDKKINKFFIISYSSADPNKIIVDFSREITDTIKILEAGFSKEDL